MGDLGNTQTTKALEKILNSENWIDWQREPRPFIPGNVQSSGPETLTHFFGSLGANRPIQASSSPATSSPDLHLHSQHGHLFFRKSSLELAVSKMERDPQVMAMFNGESARKVRCWSIEIQCETRKLLMSCLWDTCIKHHQAPAPQNPSKLVLPEGISILLGYILSVMNHQPEGIICGFKISNIPSGHQMWLAGKSTVDKPLMFPARNQPASIGDFPLPCWVDTAG